MNLGTSVSLGGIARPVQNTVDRGWVVPRFCLLWFVPTYEESGFGRFVLGGLARPVQNTVDRGWVVPRFYLSWFVPTTGESGFRSETGAQTIPGLQVIARFALDGFTRKARSITTEIHLPKASCSADWHGPSKLL